MARRRPATPNDGFLREISRTEKLALGAIGILAVLALWQLLSSTGIINPLIWASPLDIGAAFIRLTFDGALGPAAWSSLRLFLIGFAISAVGGVTVGILLGWFRRAGATFDPWVAVLYAAPRIGIIPIIIAAAGIGDISQIIVVVISAIFPIIVNTAVGVDSIDERYVRTAQSFLSSNLRMLRDIALPGALPLIFAGLRQGLTAGLIGVVIGEYFLGNKGLGGLIIQSSSIGRPADAFVAALLFAVAAIVFTALLRLIERKVSKWR